MLGVTAESFEAQPSTKHLGFRRAAAEDGSLRVVVDLRGEERSFGPEALVSMLLAKLKGLAAEGAVDAGGTAAAQPPVFGVALPPWMGPGAHRALRDAATIAGIGEVW